ncbi:M16 family metallopeptidase [Campylobacter sp. RM16192]|uniref:M16 family metallopeptidase n=1 Tax=Campylobacter sp. RM16192 TaxID=1660080 RepID=UPI0014525F6B|nr:pitrilysin family protein [Campylobacter sp. RM16192]QCD52592.1 Zn-dependent peptidase, M16 family [Campylobacter sp. RM16192]
MLLKYSKTKLKNGFEIYHIPVNKGSYVISVDLFYKVGSRNEVMGKSGIAHMLEHLNFKSTKNLKAGEFDKIVKGFGGINNASTGFDYTHYFVKCSKKNLDKSLELYADIMANLSLKDSEFQPERNVVLEERLWRTDNNPIGFLYFTLFNTAFTYHPYHWTPIGFIEDIKNWTIDDIKEFHSTFYQPKNAILLISGDIDKKSAFELGKKHFESIKNSKEIPNIHCVEPAQKGAKRVEIYKDSEVEMLAIAFKIPAFNHEDQVALNAISEYLSSGKSSAMHRILVDEKCLVNQIYAYNMDNIDEGLFIIIAVCNPEIKVETVEKEIYEILENIKKDNIDQDELTKIKNSIKSDFIHSFSSASRVANLYGDFLAKGDITPLFELQEKIENLKGKDINDISKKYFTDKTSTTVILRKDRK